MNYSAADCDNIKIFINEWNMEADGIITVDKCESMCRAAFACFIRIWNILISREPRSDFSLWLTIEQYRVSPLAIYLQLCF